MAEFEAEGLSPEDTREELAEELTSYRDESGRLVKTNECIEVLGTFISESIADELTYDTEASSW